MGNVITRNSRTDRRGVTFPPLPLTFIVALTTLSHWRASVWCQKKTNCNPLAHPTLKCHHTNLWIAKQNFFYPTEGLLRSFKRWSSEEIQLWICHRWLWKEPVVMCGNWNVRQAMSQQVFRVTTCCISTCLQSFSTLISRIAHHAVLKFSPCRNNPLPQASTCPYPYTRSSCSVPQTQY